MFYMIDIKQDFQKILGNSYQFFKEKLSRKKNLKIKVPMQCRYCDEMYHDRWSLMQHQKTHRSGRYRIAVCDLTLILEIIFFVIF